jgi:hypothetical protein
MGRRIIKLLFTASLAAFLSLAVGPRAFGQQTSRTEVVFWHAGSPLRLHVTWVENSYSVALNGTEILTSEPGDFGSVDEWVKLDPILKVGDNRLTFLGTHGATPGHDSRSSRFDVFLESTATGRWSALKDYSATGQDSPGKASPGLQYKLILKITVSE